MVEAKTTIVNKTGLHARPASDFIKFVNKMVDSNIFFVKGEKRMNAKSILNLLALGLNNGTEITVQVEGGDEQENLDKVIEYIANMED